MDDMHTRREKFQAAQQAKTAERALLDLPDSIKALMGSLSMLQAKIQKGERIEEKDREETFRRLDTFKFDLNHLLGETPNKGYERDCKKAQELVDEFVRELLEDDDDISARILRGLQSEDPNDRSTKTVTWNERRLERSEYTVKVAIPDVILDDSGLMTDLESRFGDLHGDLTQAGDHVDSDDDGTTVTIED